MKNEKPIDFMKRLKKMEREAWSKEYDEKTESILQTILSFSAEKLTEEQIQVARHTARMAALEAMRPHPDRKK